MESSPHDTFENKLYRTYWSLCLGDILAKLKYPANESNKKILHDFHKRVLGYRTISEQDAKVLSQFIKDVCLYWGERGVFVRTSRKQPYNIEWMPLSAIWNLL
jgi:hypothetical protein